MKPYVYLIFDLKKNRPYYVGKHNGTNRNYLTGSKILRKYIGLFGINAFLERFDKVLLEETTLDKLDKVEEHYIKLYRTKINGGNLTWGGKWDIKFRNPILKPVLQYDLEGNFIKEWEFVKQPTHEGIATDYNGISACCLGKQKTSNGFIWRFKEGDVPLKIDVPERKSYRKGVTRNKNKSIMIEGKTYKSITDAAKFLGWSFGKLNWKIQNNQIKYKWVK
mgnify:CR=1 FL=1